MKLKMFVMTAVAASALGGGAALAQYPGPTGNVALSSCSAPGAGGSLGTLQPNSSTCVNTAVLSSGGQPVANAACTASVSGGSGASVSPSTFTTNAQGTAQLTVTIGNSTDDVRLSVACGQATSTAVLDVAGTAPGPLPRPPATGQGTGDGTGTAWLPIGAGALGLLATAGAAFGYRRRVAAVRVR